MAAARHFFRRRALPLSTRLFSSEAPSPAIAGALHHLDKKVVPELWSTHAVVAAASGRTEKPLARLSDGATVLGRSFEDAIQAAVLSQYATSAPPEQPSPRLVLLGGVRGVGKSTSLLHTVHRARKAGFVVLYISRARDWTHGGGFFCPAPAENRDPVLEGLPAIRFYDRPQQLHSIFQCLLEAHSDQLADIPCSVPLSPTLAENAFANLRQLIEHGNALLDNIDSDWRSTPCRAGDVFHHLMLELCACETAPVLIAIDEFESLVGMTCMENESGEKLHANAIRSVAEYFGRSAIERTASSMKNGLVMLSMTGSQGLQRWRQSRVRSGTDYPLDEATLTDPSGAHWLERLYARARDSETQDAMCIDVPSLSASELQKLSAVYRPRSKQSNSDGFTKASPIPEKEQERLMALSGGRGDLLQKLYASR